MDDVNNPPHYTEGRKFQPIDVLEEFFSREPLLWQTGKYLSRCGRKGDPLKDLKKAMWYLDLRLTKRYPVSHIYVPEFGKIYDILDDWYPFRGRPSRVRNSMQWLLNAACAATQQEALSLMNECRRVIDMAICELERDNDVR